MNESLRSLASGRRKHEETPPSVSPAADYSQNPEPRCPPPSQPAPSAQELQVRDTVELQEGWTSFLTGSAKHSATPDALMQGLLETSRKAKRQRAVQDVEGDGQVSASPSRSQQKKEQKKAGEVTTLQLTHLLHAMGQPGDEPDSNAQPPSFPWWEFIEDALTGKRQTGSFHAMRTCTSDGKVGLLVDPGAHDNLAGEQTIRQLERQLNAKARARNLDHPLSVSGVGKEAQHADTALSVEFDLQEGGKCTYTAPVITGSHLPPLLGLKSLSAKRAILDTHGKLLILPGVGGIEFRCSPGTQVLALELSESGHLILPTLPQTEAGRPTMSTVTTFERVDFNVQCKTARSPSPIRSHAPVCQKHHCTSFRRTALPPADLAEQSRRSECQSSLVTCSKISKPNK